MVSEKPTRTIVAGEFKAKCLALMDEVARTGEEIIITKRGKPIARLEPVSRRGRPSLKDLVLWIGDVESPATDPDDWESNR